MRWAPRSPCVPGQDQRDEKSDDQGERNAAADAFRPTELLRDNVDALQKGERRCNVGHAPLHQLALFQALQEFVHRARPSFHPTRHVSPTRALKTGVVANRIPSGVEPELRDRNPGRHFQRLFKPRDRRRVIAIQCLHLGECEFGGWPIDRIAAIELDCPPRVVQRCLLLPGAGIRRAPA